MSGSRRCTTRTAARWAAPVPPGWRCCSRSAPTGRTRPPSACSTGCCGPRHRRLGRGVRRRAVPDRHLIDGAFVRARIAVEVDGWASHADVDRFRADRRKGNALLAAGWLVLRFTWHDLTTRPLACVAEIRAALDRSA
ncbi:MAG: endonuclease domain-containing protein [Pseudonocardia sp.]